MRIRAAIPEDLASILAIQQKNPLAAQWQRSDYTRLSEDPSGILLIAEAGAGQVVGFAAAQRVADEAELRNLAVDPEHRGYGIGQALLAEIHRRLHVAGTKRMYLEVRPSNQPAVNLYRASGYGLAGRRRNYYESPPEDALVLCMELK